MRQLIQYLHFKWGPTKKELRREVVLLTALLERHRYYGRELVWGADQYLEAYPPDMSVKSRQFEGVLNSYKNNTDAVLKGNWDEWLASL